MNIFIAGLCHETSSFSPIPTNRQSFEDFTYHRPVDNKLDEAGLALNGYGAFAREAMRQGHTIIASSYSWAQPSGPCGSAGYVSLRDEILNDLASAKDVSVVLLFLHGAQMAQGVDDCEGDLLARARAIVGPDVFIGALLDLHANVTDQMVRSASVLCACRFYPHTDFDDRAVELYRLGIAAARGEIAPLSHFQRIPMIGMFYTTEPLVAKANAAALELQQRPGVLSVSLIHGFMWADIDEMGAGVLAVTDGPRPTVEAETLGVARQFFEGRGETRALRKTIDQVLTTIESAAPDPKGRPFVIADACDNAGGGAGSDSTFLLEAILERKLTGYAIALVWDPLAAQLAAAAGVGTTFRLRLGGKTGPHAGRPLDVEATVLSIGRDLSQFGIGYRAPTGLNVALGIAGNVVIVNDVRGQVFSPTCFTDMGVSPSNQRALIVKSSQHFREQFEPIAREVLYCETPGSLALDIDPAGYLKLRRPVWPLDDVEFG
jgi:microcystin degradation protein MlrC